MLITEYFTSIANVGVCVWQGSVYSGSMLLHCDGILSKWSAVWGSAEQWHLVADVVGELGPTDCCWNELCTLAQDHPPRSQIAKVSIFYSVLAFALVLVLMC